MSDNTMRTCEYCDKSLDDELDYLIDLCDEDLYGSYPYDFTTHEKCKSEYDRRIRANLCVKCGKDSITHGKLVLCGNCTWSSKYKDYTL